MSHLILNEWLCPFIARIINIHGSGVLVALCGCCTNGDTWNCCRLGASSVYTSQPSTSLRCHFIQSYIGKVHVCSAVTCHQPFWQNERDLLRATAVTRGGTDTKIRVSIESWPGRRKFTRRFRRDSNPWPFDHESDALTIELSPLPTCHHWTKHACNCWTLGFRDGWNVSSRLHLWQVLAIF